MVATPERDGLAIDPVPCRKDNYAYLVRAQGSTDAVVVDPSDVAPVAEALERRHLRLRGILLTHHHQDHVGGILGLVERWRDGVEYVAGFAGDRGRIPGQTRYLEATQDRFSATGITIAGRSLMVRHIPGHTSGALALGIAEDGGQPSDVFTGDTLFGAGCGRLFEGTPAQMWASLQALASLPGSTRLWFGHEYTASNLQFAEHVEPDNAAVRERRASLPPRTTPTTVALERATNPFVRAPSVDVLAARRTAKDTF